MNFDPEKIYWQAHRGGGGFEAPDNTLYAMNYGWSLGGIPEADIRLTADGEVICLHDNTLRRVTDAPEEIADVPAGELTFAEIRKYDAGRKFRADCAGEKVPALREVFSLMARDREKMLYADIKNYDEKLFPRLLKTFFRLTEEFGVADQIIVAGCDYGLNCRFKETSPAIKTMQWIGMDPAARMARFRALEEKNFAGLDLVQLHLYIRKDPAPAPGEWIYDLPLDELRYAVKALGPRLEVFPFGAFTAEAVGTLLDLGIRQYATDEPKRFRAVLEAAGVSGGKFSPER